MTHESAADAHTAMAMRWCATFTEADYPVCRDIALDMIDHAAREGLDAPIFAHKSLAQSLHFLGEHRQARMWAERVLGEATGFIECTNVHPHISMSIVLARILFLEGRSSAAIALVKETLDRSRQENPIARFQVIALASAPIAIWSDDEGAARGFALELIAEAETEQLNYWRAWGHNLQRAIDLRFRPAGDESLNVDALDPLQADHLSTVDIRAVSQLALRRAAAGFVGWSVPEMLRGQATTTMWYDAEGARRLLGDAREMAARQHAVAWTRRIDDTSEQLARGFPPSLGPSRHSSPPAAE